MADNVNTTTTNTSDKTEAKAPVKKTPAKKTATARKPASAQRVAIVETRPLPTPHVAGDMIPCRCVKPNMVVYASTKTGNRYEWSGYGDINEVDFSDLQSMKVGRSKYLFAPWIIIEDEDLYEMWKRDLEPVYKDFAGMFDLDGLFEMNIDDFKSYLTNASTSMKKVIETYAVKGVKDGSVNNIAIIKAIDEILGTIIKEFV